MGGKINIVDEIPHDVPDFKEEPYDYDAYLQYQLEQNKQIKDLEIMAGYVGAGTAERTAFHYSYVATVVLILWFIITAL